MICQMCNAHEATIHLTEIVNNQMIELHICEQCAKEKSVELSPPLAFSEVLQGLVDFTTKHENQPTNSVCAKCGMTYEDFKKVGRLGCDQCYQSFQSALLPLIKKVQGAVQHVGKQPKKLALDEKVEVELKQLTEQLKKHIEFEEFEEAAKVRDQLKELEKKIAKKKSGTKKA